jgi:iron complex outermembrane receptor protein
MSKNHPLHLKSLVIALAAIGLGKALPAAAQSNIPTLGEVVVDGGYAGAADGYRADTAYLGPLGERALLDTPYAISVVPSSLMENQQMKSVRDAFRYLPSVQGENIRPQTRGLQAGVVQNTRIDGLNIAATTDYPVEQFERIEVLNGLAGALYGPANPAGTFNYVLKRPTADTRQQVTVGYATQGSLLAHADLSGSLGDQRQIGYRLNLLDDRGEGYVNGSLLHRRLASLAVDLHLAPSTVLETNFSTYHYLRRGFAGTFALANNVNFPTAPDPTKVGYGQRYAGDDNVSDTISARLKHSFNADWQFTGGVQRQNGERASTVPTNTLTNNSGKYTITAATTTYSRDVVVSNSLALTGKLQTFGIGHELVLANNGFDWDRYTPYSTGSITLGTATLDNPKEFNEPNWPDFSYRYRSVNTRQQSITFGDTLTFTDQWSVMLMASQSWIKVRNYNKQGAVTSRYDDDGLSPAASLLFKPRPEITTYLTYADSLQQGDFAPTGTANAGESLAPYRSKQWEIGYKQQLQAFAGSRLNLGAALFRIERPFAMTDSSDNRYKELGEQVNRGLELTAAGDATRNLSFFGGLTYLDPKLLDSGSAATSDKQILGLARFVANTFWEYHLSSVPGLFLNLNLNHVSRRPGNNTNSTWVSGYTVADIGARYVHKLLGKTATWRLNVNNVSDERYWANITPSGQNGYSGAGNGTGTLGAPRTLMASLQFDL